MRHTTISLTALALIATACGGSSAPSAEAPDSASAAAPAAAERGTVAKGGAAPMAPPPAPAMEESEADHDGPADDAIAGEAAPAPSGASEKKRAARAGGGAAPGRRPAEMAAAGVKAGEWDDNANYREFQKYLNTMGRVGAKRLDISDRQFLVVRDDEGRGVPRCRVTVTDSNQRRVTLTTTASGRAILFPRAEGLRGSKMLAATQCDGSTARASFAIDGADGVVRLDLDKKRNLPKKATIDVAFVLDTTGSMSEEIRAVKSTIRRVSQLLAKEGVNVRVGLVEYKDRSDDFVTKTYQMSTDLEGFARKVSAISATGGGDNPEDLEAGLHTALTKLNWKKSSVARVAFVIADAPPHLDYQQSVSYVTSTKRAAREGIQLFTIAASGMDDVGQVVWRQMAQYTGGTNMFVLRGGAGPQSTGGGDPKSSCGGTHSNYSSGNLDELIARKIRTEIRALDQNPLRIAGLGQDERAKPCEDRIVMAR